AYSWPGNVREPENVIQRAIIVSQGRSLCVEDLPEEVRNEVLIEPGADSDSSFEQQLREYKIKLAADAIRENNGSKTLAARKLRISRSYLHRLIRNTEAESDLEAENKVIG